MIHFKIRKSGPVYGQLKVPGDKSMSHRSVILGSVANGTTRIQGLLEGDDVKRTIQVFRACGVNIEHQDSSLVIEGVGIDGLEAPASDMYLGNSGTSMRLLTGIFAGQQFETIFTGDESLSNRPMFRVAKPLRRMGADISLAEGDTPPVHIKPVEQLIPIKWKMFVASAQVKSAILLAGMQAHGPTRVIEYGATRDHTEKMLRQFGCDVEQTDQTITVEGRSELRGQQVRIPADFSSAAFFIVAGLIVSNSEVAVERVGVNPTRTGLLTALKHMGASVEVNNLDNIGEEPVADIRVSAKGQLKGVELSKKLVPLMIDEIPILAIAAAVAKGRTVISGCKELRVKESDRIRSIARGLEALGVRVQEKPDGMIIEGGSFSGGQVDSFGDHRIAMAFSIAGAVASSEVEILNCDCVNTSFPEFADTARRSGIDLEVVETASA